MPAPARPLFRRSLRHGPHVRSFSVEKAPAHRWQIRDVSDADLVRQVTCEDWHRVELAVRRFEVEAAQLVREGWREM